MRRTLFIPVVLMAAFVVALLAQAMAARANPVAARDLAGSTWQILKLSRVNVPEHKRGKMALSLSETGFGAYGGCNRMSGQLELGPKAAIRFKGPFAQTKMACTTAMEDLDWELMSLLQKVASAAWSVSIPDHLELRGSDGQALIVLQPSGS